MSARFLISAGSVALLALCLTGLPVPAEAQTAPTNPVQQQPRDPNMPSTQNTVPEKIDSTGSTNNLSEKLGATGGVITPRSGIDSGIAVTPPVPNPNSTPVITPDSVPPQTK